MQIQFLGHACFVLESEHARVLTDPFSSHIGYAPVNVEADIVTLSHDNPKWHSCLDDVSGDFHVFRGLEHLGQATFIKGVKLEAVRVWEKSSDGSEADDTDLAMVRMTFSNGLRILHMGDVGHALTESQIAACGEVDVLLALAGGFPTLSLEHLLDFVAVLKPKIVVPMHFAVPGLKMQCLPVDELAGKWPGRVVWHEESSLNCANTEEGGVLHVLSAARRVR